MTEPNQQTIIYDEDDFDISAKNIEIKRTIRRVVGVVIGLAAGWMIGGTYGGMLYQFGGLALGGLVGNLAGIGLDHMSEQPPRRALTKEQAPLSDNLQSETSHEKMNRLSNTEDASVVLTTDSTVYTALPSRRARRSDDTPGYDSDDVISAHTTSYR